MAFGALGGLVESVEGTKEGGTGAFLDDQAYYDKFIRPKEEALLSDAASRSQAISRGGRAKQSGFLTAQGLGGTSIATSQNKGLTNAFKRALSESMDTARMQGEQLRRQKFAARDQERAAALSRIGTASGLEGTIGSAILSSSPFTAAFAPLHTAITATEGVLGTVGTSEVPNRLNEDAGRQPGYELQTVNYDANNLFNGGGSGAARTRGGGGQDFLRSFG